MDMNLVRSQFRQDGIFGSLYQPDGDLVAVTLEHAYLEIGGYVPKLPDGLYTCKRRLSPRFGRELFQIMDVPGCTFMEIHVGNFQIDSDGCVLLGVNVITVGDAKAISSSRIAFNHFMDLQSGIDEFPLNVSSLA